MCGPPARELLGAVAAPPPADSPTPGGKGHLGPPAGIRRTNGKSLPDSFLPSWFSWVSSEALDPRGKGWWLKRSSHRRLRHSLVRKRRTYPMLFTTGRLLKCCFPSKDAETGKPETAPQSRGTGESHVSISREQEAFVCLVLFCF